MSKVSPFSAFRLEDFPDQRAWIDKLFLPLNNVLTQMSLALNGKVAFGDNIPSFDKTISGSNLAVPISFQIEGGMTAKSMIVSQATKAGTPICLVGAWSQSGDTITVNALYEVNATGNHALDPDSRYSIALKFI